MNEHRVLVDIPEDEVRAYCDGQPIQRLSLFGADHSHEVRPDTDIGMLVEYEPGSRISYFDLARHEFDLGEIVRRKVDLRMPGEISHHFRQQIVDSARLVYAQGA